MHESPWHVLQVVANHEKRVAQHLAVRSVEHYLPLYKQRSQWTDRTMHLERPLFAGYVFLRFSPQERLSVLSIPGALHVLGNDVTGRVSSEELDRIRLGLADGYLLRPHPWLQVGIKVQVKGGIFDRVVGIVTELRKECKVVIALSAVQQCFSLEVTADQVELVKPSPSPVASPPAPPITRPRF
jgi:transcription antitermination factor NusG